MTNRKDGNKNRIITSWKQNNQKKNTTNSYTQNCMNQPYNLTIKQLLVQMSHVGTSFTIVKLVLSNYSTTMTGGFCFCRWVWAGFLRRFLYLWFNTLYQLDYKTQFAFIKFNGLTTKILFCFSSTIILFNAIVCSGI